MSTSYHVHLSVRDHLSDSRALRRLYRSVRRGDGKPFASVDDLRQAVKALLALNEAAGGEVKYSEERGEYASVECPECGEELPGHCELCSVGAAVKAAEALAITVPGYCERR